MAAMTSTFLGSAVAVKAPVKVAAKKAVAPVASLDGLKKVRALRSITTKPTSRGLIFDARPAFDDEAPSRRSVRCGPSRTRPAPIRTTRHVADASRHSPRRTSAAHRPCVSVPKNTIHCETLTSPSVLRSSQAAVVGAATVLMASPAFAATIKLGGDNGELGFFVSAPYRRSHSRRTRVRPRPIAAAFRRNPP